MVTNNGTPKQLITFEDVVMGSYDPVSFENQMHFVKQIPYKDGDIMLCSYPKCGTHLTISLIRGLLKNPSDDAKNQNCWFTLLEYISAKIVDEYDSPRIFVSHLKPKRLPESLIYNKAKVVLVVRNPKDVAVSLFYHLKNSELFNNPQSWSEFLESFMLGIVPWGDHFDYLKEWGEVIQQSKEGNNNFDVVYMYFEELKEHPMQSLKLLSRHVGYIKTDGELQRIAKDNTFAKMAGKANAGKNGVPKGLRNKYGSSVIFRKGETGDWKNHFTVAQNEVFDKLIHFRLKDSIFKFIYE